MFSVIKNNFGIKTKDASLLLNGRPIKTDKVVKSQSANYFGELKGNKIIEADSNI